MPHVNDGREACDQLLSVTHYSKSVECSCEFIALFLLLFSDIVVMQRDVLWPVRGNVWSWCPYSQNFRCALA